MKLPTPFQKGTLYKKSPFLPFCGCFKLLFFLIFPFFVSLKFTEAKKIQVHGAGATFPYPAYTQWVSKYHQQNPSILINYQGIGSGGGIRQLISKTIDFAGSDVVLKPEEEDKIKRDVVHLPTLMGAVALSYNLKGLKKLHLNRKALLDIFRGKIQKWNHPLLQKLNPKIKLPSQSIVLTVRSDGSGTTAIFTQFLSYIDPKWKKEVGHGKVISWPTKVIAGKGNSGVTGLIKQVKGSLGYIEYTYATSNRLPVVAMENRQGEFVLPSLKSIKLSASSSHENKTQGKNKKGKNNEHKDFKISVLDSENKGAYPISSLTWLIIPEKMRNKEKGKALFEFLNWAIQEKGGQALLPPMHYVPLPSALQKRVLAKIQQMSL